MGVALPNQEPTVSARLLAGKYRLIRPLGEGAMGSVWQAEHLTLHSSVAIKLLDPIIAASSLNLRRFLHEARAAAALRSPHVVQILDHGVHEGTPFIVMEQLEGESLDERLERCVKLSPEDTARVVTHIARALSRAHAAGIVHRDLKPSNVFLVNNDDDELAKLLDFGIAKSLRDAKESSYSSTIPGELVGTPYYMSPEQAQGASTLDHRADIWALGVIAYECLLGRRPFEGSTLSGLLIKIREEPSPIPSREGPVPPGFDAWFARACAREPAERFDSAKRAAEEFRRACQGESPRATRQRSRWPLWLSITLASSAAVFGALALGLLLARPGATLHSEPHPLRAAVSASVAATGVTASIPAEDLPTSPSTLPASNGNSTPAPTLSTPPKVVVPGASFVPTKKPDARAAARAGPNAPTSPPPAPRPSSNANANEVRPRPLQAGVDLGI